MLAEQHGRLMGTDAHLVVGAADRRLLADAWRHLQELERRWSRFIGGSDVSRINRSAGRWTEVAPETAELLRTAIAASLATDGRFSPTVGAAMIANGYGRTFGAGPTPITDPLPAPPAIAIDIDGSAVRVAPGTTVDLGGIGKGHAADLVVDALREGGAANVVVAIGGDVRCAGGRPDGSPWPLHIAESEPFVGLHDGAVCMSTVTRRRWSAPDGDRHHLVDPASGRCLDNGLLSVAVACATATQAEVVTKSLLVLGAAGAPPELAGLGLLGRLWMADGRTIDFGRAEAMS